jgi:GNAT superfamily N-acetyltransferase
VDANHLTPAQLWRAYSYVPLRLAHSSECGEAFVRPGGLLAMAGVPDADWNWGFVYGPDDPEEALLALVGRLREKRLPGYLVASAEVDHIVGAAAGRLGLVPAGTLPLLLNDGSAACAPRHLPATSITTESIDDEATFLASHSAAAAAFSDDAGYTARAYRPVLLELPGVRLFAARDEGSIVARAATIHEGDIVWFFDVGTHPDSRGRGAATALLLAAMDWWRRRGQTAFGLGAEAEARPLYESLGFRLTTEARMWLVEGPARDLASEARSAGRG